MAKRERPSARATRPARTPVQGIRATLGTVECTVANVSNTGALLRSRREAAVGGEAQLRLELPTPVVTRVRVVRCEPIDVPLPGAVWRRQDFALGIHFVDRTDALATAIRALARDGGVEHSEARLLVLGREDQASRLIERALADADYNTRLLTHPRYAVSTARRIGAKAIVVNLAIDPQFSARSVLDALRAAAETASLPIVLCAPRASLHATHQRYIADKRLRLLLVPFTPEELVATVDRAIAENR